MTVRTQQQALLIQLEFPTWQMARPWTYSAGFAIQEGLEANGIECTTIPAIPSSPSGITLDWLRYAQRICNGKRFDQVWVWLVHYEYDQPFMEWIASLAPLRVGFVMESLTYSEEEHRFSPITRQRKAVVDRQLPYLTHALFVDEVDAQMVDPIRAVKSLWCPSFVPERFIVQQEVPPSRKAAVFHGTIYGHRKSWLENAALKGRLMSAPSQVTEVQKQFDQLHAVTAEALPKKGAAVELLLSDYLTELKRIRLAEFAQWMDGLAQWTCIVNLPGFQKGYGGRVYEAMAAGRPVISWDIPNRPRNGALFEDEKEILLFPPEDPGVLTRHIARVLDDPDYAAQVARNAHRKMAIHHSAENRIKQILLWMESGIQPTYGEGHTNRGVIGKQSDAVPSCTVPTVSIIVPCYNQAQFLSEAVESVVTQVYRDWECIIVDDGSPDQTSVVARQLIERHPDKPIRVISKANGGLADARNAGIREAKGRYILPLDADDKLHPEYLSLTVPVLDQQTTVSIVYVDEQNFGETTHIHRKGVVDLENLLRSNVHDYCSLYRRSVWEAVGGYSPAMYIGAEDWNFWITAAKRGFHSFHVAKPLFCYRNRQGTMIEQVQKNVEVVKAHLIMHHPELFTPADRAQAQAILSQLSDKNKERLAHTCSIHPANVLLEMFRRLAHGQGGMFKPIHEQGFGGVTRSRTTAPDSVVTGQPSDEHDHDDAYYAELFIKNPEWSASEPNGDETARWVKIASFLEHILRLNRRIGITKPLRILDLGCGRGWLTNLASTYGVCTGVEPVSAVVAHARRLFPHLNFHAGTADTLLTEPGFEPFDVVLTSEVIEHVPRPKQVDFVQLIRRLVKPGGHVVLTTPRGEVFDLWRKIAPPNQPIEDWLTEDEIKRLFIGNQFTSLGNEHAWIDLPSFRFIPAPTPADHQARKLIPFYQIWAWQAPGEQGVRLQMQPFMPIPMVSVIVPTYNRPDRLREALASIQAQTFKDFEIIVVNDGTIDVGSVIANINSDGRITYIKHSTNRGLAAARNTGLRAAKGKYVAYLDDDDRYLPNHLETLVKCLNRGEFKAAYTDAWRVHEQSEGGQYFETGRDLPYSNDFNPANLLVSNFFPVLCVMHERACIDEVGGFDESLFAHEDWDLWIRMATKYPFQHLKCITAEFTWRMDGSSMTSSTRDTYVRTTAIIYQKYRPYAELNRGVLEAQKNVLLQLQAAHLAHSVVCSIVIPVWNKVELTGQCLTALAFATTGVPFEVIIVDNGSTDGTPEFLAGLGGDVQIIRNQTNLGFAKACNQGARMARGKYVVFLNNDTIPQPGWLEPLVSEVEQHPEVGIVGGKLLFPDGSIQHAGVVFTRSQLTPYHVYKSASGTDHSVNQRREFQAVTAACMLIRREMFEELQGFDERFLNGLEDVDLCLRAREKGCQIIYQPRSMVYHLENQTPGRKDHEERNDRLFTERWGSQWWIGDQDLHYYHDGKKLMGGAQDKTWATELSSLNGTLDRAAWAHVAAAQAAALKRDWAGVKRELQMAADWPNDRFVLAWGALVAERLQESNCRVKFLARYVALVEEPAKRLELTRLFLEQNNLQKAEEQLRSLLSVSPDHAEGLLLQGILCMQREQYEQAETAFGSAFRQGAGRRKCLMGMGMASMGRGYAQGAWERFREVLVDFPDDAEAIHWLLRAGTAQNRWHELAEHLHLYVTRNPGDLASRFAYASVLLRGEQIHAARREYDALSRVAPTYDGLEQLGRAISGREAVLSMEPAA